MKLMLSNYKNKINIYIEKFLRMLYPKRCIFCYKVFPEDVEEDVCPECEKSIDCIGNPACVQCGIPIEHYGKCSRCAKNKYFFDEGFAVYVYKDFPREAILRFKFSDMYNYAEYFGYTMARYADVSDIPFVDYVVPVPIHKCKLLKRGYNQSLLLAEVYAREREEVCVEMLVRVKNTKPQNNLNSKAREKNIKGAFALIDENINLKGKSIMLIDDIFTTGSTINECARVLKKHGADKVYSFCLSIRELGEKK